jgi:hypothetical protein
MRFHFYRAVDHLVGATIASIALGACGTNHESGADGGTSGNAVRPADDAGSGSAMVESDAMPIDPNGGGGATTDASVDDPTKGLLATRPPDDGAPPPLWIADSAPVRASDCKPGTYTGTFVMMVGFGGLGGGPTLNGTLSITLLASKPTPGATEFNTGILTVAPGAMFSGKDNYGDVWIAELSGQLDCGTRMFVGSLFNGQALVFGNDATVVTLDGSLSATYDPGANPVALVNGSIELSSPQVAGTTGKGTWSAALQ